VPDLLADEAALAPGTAWAHDRQRARPRRHGTYSRPDALGRQVAIKVLAPHLTRDNLQRERLRREARAAAALTHPGICAVYALEEIGDELVIVTEVIDGDTLRHEIASGRRPTPSEIIRTAKELAAALADAHSRGVIHRDLKPENIMRTRDGRLKILDFGLAPRAASAAGAS
jgi:serine/threonine protein kinase